MAHNGSLESSEQTGKDGVFSIYASAIFPTWRTLKPEVDDNSEQTALSTKFSTAPPHFSPRSIHQSHWRHRPTTPTILSQHGRHETGSRLHLQNGMSYLRNSNGYPRIPTATPPILHHAQFTKVTGDIVRQLILPYINMADTKLEVNCISETEKAI